MRSPFTVQPLEGRHASSFDAVLASATAGRYPPVPMPRRDVSLQRLAVRILFAMALGLSIVFAAELAIDLARSDVPWSHLGATSNRGQSLASTVSRAFNNLTAMVLTFIALAVPLTANMYTPKLIEIFVRDKVNIAAMLFFAGMGAHAVFGQAVMYEQWHPAAMYTALWVSGVVGFIVLIPYYFYVLAFLNPVTIIRRVTDAILHEFDDIAAHRRDAPEARRRLNQEILNFGNVILRAVDRADRDVSLDAIRGLQRAVVRYGEIKPSLDAAWFDAEPALFTGQSRDAIGYVMRDRVWVEQKCLHQLLLAYSAALTKMPDALSEISGVNRRVAETAQGRGDEKVVLLCVRYFNTFLREAVKKRDVHAVYDVYSQYTFLAKGLLDATPDVVLAIARHFLFYAGLARAQGTAFVHELAACDLCSLVEAAYAAQSARRADLLAVFLEIEPDGSGARIAKAQASLAACFDARGLAAERDAVVSSIARSGLPQIAAARREIAATVDPMFWEVTDRQTNLDWLEPKRREAALAALDDAARKCGGGGAP